MYWTQANRALSEGAPSTNLYDYSKRRIGFLTIILRRGAWHFSNIMYTKVLYDVLCVHFAHRDFVISGMNCLWKWWTLTHQIRNPIENIFANVTVGFFCTCMDRCVTSGKEMNSTHFCYSLSWLRISWFVSNNSTQIHSKQHHI